MVYVVYLDGVYYILCTPYIHKLYIIYTYTLICYTLSYLIYLISYTHNILTIHHIYTYLYTIHYILRYGGPPSDPGRDRAHRQGPVLRVEAHSAVCKLYVLLCVCDTRVYVCMYGCI